MLNFLKNQQKRDLIKLIDVNDPRVSIVRGKKVREFLQPIFGNATFKDTKIPLRIGATSLEDGSKVIFKEGKIIDAVMESHESGRRVVIGP